MNGREMNRRELTKQYSVICLCLAVISCIILLITPLIPAIEVDLGFIKSSESGISCFSTLFDFVTGNNNATTVNEYGLEISSSSSTVLQNAPGKIWIGVAAMICLVSSFGLLVSALKKLSSLCKEATVGDLKTIVSSCMILNIIYYAFCIILILVEYDWQIGSILNGSAILKTKTHILLFLQIALMIATKFFYGHWRKAGKGLVKPVDIGVRESAAEKAAAPKTSSSFSASPSSPSSSATTTASTTTTTHSRPQAGMLSELERVELLKKYKELFDSEVITQEEFEAKKQELLKLQSKDS